MYLFEVNLVFISISNLVQMESFVENIVQNGQINEEDDEQIVGGVRDFQIVLDVVDIFEIQSDIKFEFSFVFLEDEIEYILQKNFRLVKVFIMFFQKREIVIMRLINRIKVLEINVFLSSRQFLMIFFLLIF